MANPSRTYFNDCPVCHQELVGLSGHLKRSDVCRWVIHRRLFGECSLDEPEPDPGPVTSSAPPQRDLKDEPAEVLLSG